ncbi:hypothetical protein MRX96_019070 [Rhipicephalus microplus]
MFGKQVFAAMRSAAGSVKWTSSGHALVEQGASCGGQVHSMGANPGGEEEGWTSAAGHRFRPGPKQRKRTADSSSTVAPSGQGGTGGPEGHYKPADYAS